MLYDTAIILANELVKDNGNYNLSDLTRNRVDLGIEYYQSEHVKGLLMSGGHKDNGQKYGISLAQAMKEYAVRRGVFESDIIKEEISLETAGQLIFCKLGIIKPRRLKNILIITHDWHMPRTRRQAKFIFGEDYNLEFRSVSDSGIRNTFEKEQASYETFLKTFKGINSGDDNSILNRLLERHPWYEENSKRIRDRLKQLAGI